MREKIRLLELKMIDILVNGKVLSMYQHLPNYAIIGNNFFTSICTLFAQ